MKKKSNIPPKDAIIALYPDLTENQLIKLVEAYFTINWINPNINIAKFLEIISEKFVITDRGLLFKD